jgi:CBS domain containing-hemolysin-like protein
MLFEINILIGFVLLSAFFSGSETALLSISLLKLKHLIKTYPNSKRVRALYELKSNMPKTLLIILIGNNLVNISLTVYATYLAVKYLGEQSLPFAAIITTIFMILFGEIVPKNFGALNSEKFALFCAIPIKIIGKIISPIANLIEKMIYFIFGEQNIKRRRTPLSESELKTFLEIGVEDKTISPDEKKFFERILDFNDTYIKEIMTPAKEVITLKENYTALKALDIAIKYKKNRYPVLDEKNKVVGIVNLKDLIELKPNEKINRIIKPPYFVSTEGIAYDVFREMQKQKKHIAIVIGPDSTFKGIITIEDLLEEIVGEIEESYKIGIEEEKEKGELIVNGETSLHDLEKEFLVKIPEAEKLGSVSSLFHYYYKRPPKKGDKIILSGLKLEVIQTGEMHYLQQIKIKKIS